jgi:uncharacterized protein (DUF58 family)
VSTELREPAAREPTVFTSRLLLFLVGIVLFVALLYRAHALSLLAAVLLAIVGGARLWSLAALSRLSCTCRLDRTRVFPGEAVCLDTVVENAKFLPVGIQMNWSAADALEPEDPARHLNSRRAALLWHQQVRFPIRLLARRRGLHRVGPSLLRAGDLFGIFARDQRLDQTAAVVVYPRLVPVRVPELPRRELFGSPGVKSPVEDPAFVLGTRDYASSRPSRHIHWKASARLGRLQEKVFEPSAQGKILLALTVEGYRATEIGDAEAAAAAFEGTLEVIASLAVRLGGRGFAVGFLSDALPAGAAPALVPAGRGPGQLPAILEALALLEPASRGRLESVIRCTSALSGGVACVVFCRAPNEDTAQVARLCRECGVPVSGYAWQPAGGSAAERTAGPAAEPATERAAGPAAAFPVRRIDELRVAAPPPGGAPGREQEAGA